MKTSIQRMHVEGFGKLHDRRYELTGPVTLFYGPNEAGKSTLLAFLRAMLFGLPSRGSTAERHEPLSGGAHGGSLTLTDGQGRELRVERRFGGGAAAGGRGRAGSSAGSVRVHASPEDVGIASSGAEVQLNALLGGLSADLFRSLFAFSLTELQELSSLQAEELSGYLYSAGWGTSGRAVIAVEKRLAQEAERLYRPRGKNQELALAIRAWEDEEAALQRSREQLAGYNRLAAELASVDAEIVDASELVHETRASVTWTDKLLQAEQPFRRMERIRLRLGELPVFDTFPVDAGKRYERAAAELEARLSTISKLQARRTRLEQQLKEHIQLDPLLLENKLMIEELLERSGAYRDQQDSLAERAVERQLIVQDVKQLLGQLGAEWTEERLTSVPLTVIMKERLRSWDEERHQLLRKREGLMAELEGAERQEAEAHRELSQQQARQERKRLEVSQRFASWRAELSGEELRYHMQQLRREQAEWMKRYTEHRQLSSSIFGAEDGIGRAIERTLIPMHRSRELMVPVRGQSSVSRRDVSEQLSAPLPGTSRQRAIADASRAAASQHSPHSRGGGHLRAAAWVLAGFAAVVPAALWAAGQPGLAAGSFAALSIGAGYIAYRARRAAVENGTPLGGSAADNSEAAERELLRLEQELAELGAKLSRRLSALMSAPLINSEAAREAAAASDPTRPIHFTEDWLEQLELEADMRLTVLQEIFYLDNAVEEALAYAGSITNQRQLALTRYQGNEQCIADWQADWDKWLLQHGLPTGLTPAGAAGMLREIERGREWINQLNVVEKQLESLRTSIRSFQEQASNLCKPFLGEGWDKNQTHDLDWVAKLKELQTSAEVQRVQANLRLQAEHELTLLQAELEAAEEDRKRQEQGIQDLWSLASADTIDQFLLHTQQHEDRNKLLEELRELEYLLLTLIGRERQEECTDALRSCTADMLEEERTRYEAKQNELEQELNLLRDRRGRLKNEMEKLESGEDHADRMLRVEAAATEVQLQARRWATLTLASSLFRTARARYETERQPSVLLAASHYFARMTEGMYVRVTAPIGEKRLIVYDQDGRAIDSASLSRGTAEQLYLSMRFAFAEEYGHKTAMPLIMDDVFVNFDPQRLKQCFQVVREIAERHQVLFFTCHPHVLQAASEAIPSIQLIEL